MGTDQFCPNCGHPVFGKSTTDASTAQWSLPGPVITTSFKQQLMQALGMPVANWKDKYLLRRVEGMRVKLDKIRGAANE